MPCPDNSYGEHVPSGCTTIPGYSGQVIATTDAPDYFKVQMQSGALYDTIAETGVDKLRASLDGSTVFVEFRLLSLHVV